MNTKVHVSFLILVCACGSPSVPGADHAAPASAGEETPRSDAKDTAPSAPSVRIAHASEGLRIEWDEVANAASYVVSRSTALHPSAPIAQTSARFVVDAEVVPLETYTYEVAAVSNAGTIGAANTVTLRAAQRFDRFRATRAAASFTGIAFGPKRVVISSLNGTLLVSDDGAEFSAVEAGIRSALFDVAWTGSEFIAVGSDVVARSADGLTWTHSPAERGYRHISSDGQGLCVAISLNDWVPYVGRCDGAWTTPTNVVSTFNGKVRRAKLYASGDQRAALLLTDKQVCRWFGTQNEVPSQDYNWSCETAYYSKGVKQASGAITDVVRIQPSVGPAYYIGVGFDHNRTYYWSSDAANWVLQEGLSTYLRYVDAIGQQIIVLGDKSPTQASAGENNGFGVPVMIDLPEETNVALPFNDMRCGVLYAKQVCLGVGGDIVVSRQAAKQWAVVHAATPENLFFSVLPIASGFLALDLQALAAYHINALGEAKLLWSDAAPAPAQPGMPAGFIGMAMRDERAVGVSMGGKVCTSNTTLDTWSCAQLAAVDGVTGFLLGVVDLGDQLVVYGSDGLLLTSATGDTWTRIESDLGNAFVSALVRVGDHFVASTSAGVATSSDLSDWTVRTDKSVMLTSLAANGNTIVGASMDGNFWRSLDAGASWHAVDDPASAGLTRVRHVEGRFVGLGGNGAMGISFDGVAWTRMDFGASYSASDITSGPRGLCVVGADGLVMLPAAVQP